MITVKVVPAYVTDADGYLIRNADDTHYVDDAVALRYEVDYRFKDGRRGVIEPEVTRTHPYPRIADLDCLQESCTLVVPATAATTASAISMMVVTPPAMPRYSFAPSVLAFVDDEVSSFMQFKPERA